MTLPRYILPALLVLLLLLLNSRLWFGNHSVQEVQQLDAHIAQLQQAIALQQQHNQLLQAQISQLKQNGPALQELIRSRLGLIERGEVFYLMSEP